MPRAVAEWIGKTDDTPPPPRVKARLLRKHDFKCALTGRPFAPGEKPQFDHIRALINDGENRENNLQPVWAPAHKEKTKDDIAEKVKADARTIQAFKLESENKRKMRGPQFHKKERQPKIDFTTKRPMFQEITSGK